MNVPDLLSLRHKENRSDSRHMEPKNFSTLDVVPVASNCTDIHK